MPAMIDDLDIYRSANLLIRRHGHDAAKEATKRVDAMLASGDLEGQRAWRRVLQAIDMLQAKDRPAGAAVN